MIAHNVTTITADDRASVDLVLRSGWIAQGPEVERLEQTFVELYGGGAACAVANGTTALFLTLKAAGISSHDRVAVPSYACSALLNAVHMSGAVPAVVDVSAETFTIDPQAFSAQAPDARFVVAVHTFGSAADVDALRPGPYVIEDCCQAIGGRLDGQPIGARGDAAVFSFYATKIVTGGQGGVVWSADRSIVESIRDYREFDGRDEYIPRFNVQMTDLQAALAVNQMRRLDCIRIRRRAIASIYLSALPSGLGVHEAPSNPDRMPHRFVVIAPDRVVRDALRKHMAAAGVDCRVPIERFELLHRYLNLDPEAYPVSERLAETTLSLPMHLSLSDDDVARVAVALGGFAA